MGVVATAIVGLVLLAWIVIAVATAARVRAGRLHRSRTRAPADVPQGFVADATEPAVLRAPFALMALGHVVDLPHAYHGTWQGRGAAIADVVIRFERGAEPVAHTVVVLELDQRFPWTRLRRRDVAAPDVAGLGVDLSDLAQMGDAAAGWVLEGADPTFVAELVSEDLLGWLDRLRLPLQVELLPRHLLVAVTGRLPSPDLALLLGVATEFSGHVPTTLWQAHLPPSPSDEWAQP